MHRSAKTGRCFLLPTSGYILLQPFQDQSLTPCRPPCLAPWSWQWSVVILPSSRLQFPRRLHSSIHSLSKSRVKRLTTIITLFHLQSLVSPSLHISSHKTSLVSKFNLSQRCALPAHTNRLPHALFDEKNLTCLNQQPIILSVTLGQSQPIAHRGYPARIS